ncbi:hypothetical protein SAMN03159341_103529 [Paenibacillus sp. 1_12]|uniref:hypothetical protein n=1 Tax=Paenibacillus sp. 1_12 TaxID=1566278 RepID=UPI0008F20887|nr:hypothetical protein [Paenibacillus sp. 1_12]SFL15703.1 hypothetical protein SAMN03159341_103529 [Paenibacillus sp. 1_12]
MKKSMLSIGLISSLSVTILCGAVVAAKDRADDASAPPSSFPQHHSAVSSPNRESQEAYQQQLVSKSEVILKTAADLSISTEGLGLQDVVKAIGDHDHEIVRKLGLAPPPHPEGRSFNNQHKKETGPGRERPDPRPERDASSRTKASADPVNGNTPAPVVDSSNAGLTASSVVISGGFITDPQDKGRPVVLIAAALGVPTEVFREAFSGVTPAGLERGPTGEEAQRNKAALLKVLGPYGITNERLDEVSNYYRYNGSNGGTWPRTQATAAVTVTDGIVTDVKITNPGSGYTSNPTITIMGPNGKITAEASLSYTKDFKINGSISAITIK